MFDVKLYDDVFDRLLNLRVDNPAGDNGGTPPDEDCSVDETVIPESRPQVVHPLANNVNALSIDIFAADGGDRGGTEETPRLQISSRAHKQFVLLGYDGLSSPSGELAHIDHAILDGGAVSGARAQARRITLDFVANWMDYPSISSLFPLGQKEVIKVSRGGTVRTIEGFRDGPIEVSAASAWATPLVSVSFLCPSPYFRDHAEFSSSLDSAMGGLEYAAEYPVHYGVLQGDGAVQVYNGGDYPAPFVLRMIPNTSGVLSIWIDGEELAVISSVISGREIVFDTANKMLSMGGQKRLRDLMRGTFPALPIGESRVELRGAAGSSQIEFSEIFEGV